MANTQVEAALVPVQRTVLGRVADAGAEERAARQLFLQTVLILLSIDREKRYASTRARSPDTG